jgi:hypothetical protein
MIRGCALELISEDRLALTSGRDIVLVPRQASPPLNVFVYPYAEVDGQTWPSDRIQLSCGYADHEQQP